MHKNLIFFLFVMPGFIGFGQDTRGLKEAMAVFWESQSLDEKNDAAKKIIKLKPDFYEVYRMLQKGKPYKSDIKNGFVEKIILTPPGLKHYNVIFVPFDYDPKQKYDVKIFLHGAVSQSNPKQLMRWIDTSDVQWKNVKHIGIYPAAWCESKWWNPSQAENINQLIRFAKENYNVDDDRVFISGISDGATGAFYFANAMPSPFSGYVPMIGSLEAIAFNGEKQVYFQNLQGQSFFVVNTSKDPIFKLLHVKPYMAALEKYASDFRFVIVDSSAHNTNWYPVLQDSIEGFIRNTRRNPFPPEISFATENLELSNRKFWVRIDQLGPYGTESPLTDPNEIDFQDKKVKAFMRLKKSGQIEAVVDSNVIRVKTKGVLAYTLFLSPGQIDFSKPVKIYTNQNITYEGSVTENLEVLLHNFIADYDRSMLYALELRIKLGRKFKP